MNRKDFWKTIQGRISSMPKITVRTANSSDFTAVDSYWDQHIVNSKPFETQKESLGYLEWRFDEYPLFRALMGLWGDHTNQIVLDYGCGPGNDLTGFVVYSNAK